MEPAAVADAVGLEARWLAAALASIHEVERLMTRGEDAGYAMQRWHELCAAGADALNAPES